ncbi:MAG: bifunctional UDP-N-acetylglucosamine diphosphorylase/glucosamine-1-phosphate N-acetyltransferase GlmU [Solirubrobacteraceae bacterium]|nr:bifunctional UDP-N-acetylglucosamine diphosphorylase/glucosamine-1-phosphate N-acetyltransferase GlmU [Solirubrobacteraceae bacterium]
MTDPHAPTVIVLAAGRGTRMRSATPKVLHEICGRPLVGWVLAAATGAGAHRVIVVDQPARVLDGRLPEGVDVVAQVAAEHGDGTAGAVTAAAGLVDPDRPVVVLAGDVPLITADAVAALAAAHAGSGAAATLLTTRLDDPTGYGRVVRDGDGRVVKVVETKEPGDATEEELRIDEVNAGIYAFDGRLLLDALDRVGDDNAQGERYLPDVLGILRGDGHAVAAHRLDDPALVLGVNDRAQLAVVRRIAQDRIHAAHLRAGVTIVNPESTVVDLGVAIAPDATIEPGCVLRGATTVAAGAVVGPHTVATDATIGEGATVVHSHVLGATVEAAATVGPFAYLRPGTVLRPSSKAGAFVEIKNSDVGEGSKVPHLSYIGDADIGAATNLGAATITANYDGYRKHRTTIGSGVRTGVDTTLVAPVTVGDDAYTGAGSVVTRDVPAGALGVARARQRNVDGYAVQAAARAADRR